MASSDHQPASALVLFDIDGTLLRRSGPHHRKALVEAIRRFTGIETTTDGIALQGMLDRDILARMMREGGLSLRRIRALMPDIIEAAQSIYEQTCPDLSRKVCPGARAVLRKLERHSIPAALVTGNLSRIGWKKLERAGLASYFRFGAFSEQATTRIALARHAIRRARREGLITRDANLALVGDHPNDILAARANKIRSIAVATGLSPADELAAFSPDYLLADLRGFDLAMLQP